jgi:hypothetical protein
MQSKGCNEAIVKEPKLNSPANFRVDQQHSLIYGIVREDTWPKRRYSLGKKAA